MKFYLCRLVNHILRAMETSNVTHLISVDLQKTFNCLAHETLLEKIHLLAVFFKLYWCHHCNFSHYFEKFRAINLIALVAKERQHQNVLIFITLSHQSGTLFL